MQGPKFLRPPATLLPRLLAADGRVGANPNPGEPTEEAPPVVLPSSEKLPTAVFPQTRKHGLRFLFETNAARGGEKLIGRPPRTVNMEMPGQGFLNSGATASAKLAHDAWPKGGILHNKLRSRAVGKGDYPNYPPGQQKKRREKSRVFIKDFPNGNRSPSPGRA